MQKDISNIIKTIYDVELDIELTRPESIFGDFSTNVAMQLVKQLKKNPREIAQKIADEIAKFDYVDKVDIAGPGFINIFLTDSKLIDLVYSEPEKIRKREICVIETNNPNPFKAIHIGHAMNSIVADTLANLIEISGSTTHRVSYHGDVGLHVGKSMYSLLKYADGDISKIDNIPENERNEFMSKMYAEGSKAYKSSPEIKSEIDVLAKESFDIKDEFYRKVYELCKEWSFDDIKNTMVRLGNKNIEKIFLESQSDPIGVEVVKGNTPKVFEKSDGAYIFRGSEHGSFDNVFVASNGQGLYAARDLGLMQLKNEAFHPDKSYIVTGNEQAQYFKGVISAASLIDENMKDQTVNIPTGLVKLTTGKMSSRDGDVITVAWLFDQFKNAIDERGGDSDDSIISGALRYQFLKVKIGSDVIFDINDAVSLSGNTGSYLQYAHARACRILEKSPMTSGEITDIKTEDYALIRKLGEFSEIIEVASRKLEPHHICNYLFELAQEFNNYYEKNRIIGCSLEQHRLNLVNAYKQTLKNGLEILGITPVEKM